MEIETDYRGLLIDIKDLMVGDWVRCCVYDPETDLRPYIDAQVVRINGSNFYVTLKGGGYANIYEDIKDLSPIPITPEILERNGFEKIGTISKLGVTVLRWVYYTENLSIEVVYPTEGISLQGKVSIVSRVHIGELSLRFLNLYVHELQHALRLCGVEKEIEL